MIENARMATEVDLRARTWQTETKAIQSLQWQQNDHTSRSLDLVADQQKHNWGS